MRIAILLLAFLALSVALAGCGAGTATVSGTVTFAGRTVEKGTISFAPLEGQGQAVQASIVDGRYELQVTPGNKRVQISAPVVTGTKKEHNGPGAKLVEITKESLPDCYHVKSELTFEVTSGAITKNWDLLKK